MTVVTSTLALEEVNPVATKSSPDHSPAKAYPPPRLIPTSWPTTQLGPSEVLTFVSPRLRGAEGSKRRAVARRGLVRMLDFLGEHPGDTWQQRWVASGADSAGDDWAQGPAQWLERTGLFSASRLAAMTASLPALIGADVIRPTLRWLLTGGKKRKMTTNLIRSRDPQGFAAIASECQRDPELGAPAESAALFRAAVILTAKGGKVADITVGDFLEEIEVELDVRGKVRSGSASFKVLRELGIFGDGVPTLRELRSSARPSVEELVDRYPIASRAVRGAIIEYLKERQPSMDYSSLRNRSYVLGRCFWSDLEAHHPGIDSLRLDAEVASAWKQRLHTRPPRSSGEATQSSVERLSYLDVLAAVRAFYLDVAEWALDDPARWAQWVAPCPISPQELTRRKAVRRRKARMDARTRERLPVLPVLVRTVDEWRRHSAALLVAARSASPGETFSVDDVTLVRAVRPHAATANVWADDPRTGEHRSLSQEEERAFWAWAVIEVLRSTGLRVEELLELSHYSLVQYRLPTSGELVPLLQIAPSKTDAERVIVVGPELSEVLSSIILRIRDGGAAVPLVRARDRNEQVWLPAAPLLFQRRRGAEHHAISGATVSALLDEALARSGLVDLEGAPLRCTPHDFRRIFITDAIRSGLPPHIAQIVAGHHNINVTMGYNAVYPDDAIQAHLAFLARRRALRPNEEYRTPTDEEWEEFLGHFERRKVSIGTCGRSFGSPCIHEHACVRCSMLWPDPSQRHRLVEIRDNLVARIAEARTEGWLGEIEGLEVSLAGAEEKLTQMERRAVKAVPVTLRRD
jgi:integrase